MDQKILDASENNCFASCRKQKDQTSDWVFSSCPEGKGWCCSLIANSKNYKLVVPHKIKKQCVRTYFNGFVDTTETPRRIVATEKDAVTQSSPNNQTSISEIVVHNSKNIHTNIVSKIQNIFPSIDVEENKIDYILREIQLEDNFQNVARELLSVWKSLSQQSFQYSVADYIDAKKLNLADFGMHRIYTIIKMSYFQYEDDFIERNIGLNMDPYDGEVCCHFDTIKATFCALLENCIKYCRQNTSIDISFNEKDDIITTTIAMESRYIDQTDVPRIFEYANRGKFVSDLPGKGIGLWMMKKMVQLNYGQVTIKPSENRFNFNDSTYGKNIFRIQLYSKKKHIREHLA